MTLTGQIYKEYIPHHSPASVAAIRKEVLKIYNDDLI